MFVQTFIDEFTFLTVPLKHASKRFCGSLKVRQSIATVQESNGAQSASKLLGQRTKEMKGLLTDLNVCALNPEYEHWKSLGTMLPTFSVCMCACLRACVTHRRKSQKVCKNCCRNATSSRRLVHRLF